MSGPTGATVDHEHLRRVRPVRQAAGKFGFTVDNLVKVARRVMIAESS